MKAQSFKTQNSVNARINAIVKAVSKIGFEVNEGEFGDAQLYIEQEKTILFVKLSQVDDEETIHERYNVRVEFIKQTIKSGKEKTLAEFDFTTMEDLKEQVTLFKAL